MNRRGRRHRSAPRLHAGELADMRRLRRGAGARRPSLSQKAEAGASAGPRRAQRAALSTPGMGDRLGVKVPWRKR